MTNLINLTTAQLHRIIAIKEQIEKLQGQLDSIAGGEIPVPLAGVKLPKMPLAKLMMMAKPEVRTFAGMISAISGTNVPANIA